MALIHVERLTKTFRTSAKQPGVAGALKALVAPQWTTKTAVDSISFSVDPGEIVGYIGINGAGKSTTIKMLTGILVPTSGTVEVLGRNPHRERVANAREIGVVFGQRSQLWWDLALRESLVMIARLYDLPEAEYRARLAEFAELLDLNELLPMAIRSMSLGQKMRAELAATLLHRPRIVYLDEPTIGLDLIVKDRIRAFIREQNQRMQTTVILTTHDLGDIEELCKRVIIIDAGKLIYDGPLSTIRDRFGKFRTITFEAATHAIPTDLRLPPGAEREERPPSDNPDAAPLLSLRFDRTMTSASAVAAAVMQQVEVADFSLKEPDLTSIVKQIYNGALSQASATQPASVPEVVAPA